MTEALSPRQFHEASGVEGWQVVGEGVCAFFRTASFAAAAKLVAGIAQLEGLWAHHPDVDVRGDGVMVRLVTVSASDFGLTEQDLELAQAISRVAKQQGIAADPNVVQTVQVTIDALDIPTVKKFWRAALGYVDRADSAEDLIDPLFRNFSIWFQQMDAPRPQRNRVHFDVWVAHDRAEARVAAALAAGGRMVSDENAPIWWVLADPEGNEVCVATWRGRG